MPSQIQGGGRGSPSALLSRAFRLAGRFPTYVDEIVVPLVVVADLSQAGPIPETRIAVARFSQAAVALESCICRLEVPAGVIARVTEVYPNVVAAGADSFISVFMGSSVPAPAALASKAFTDGRLRVRGETPAGVLAYGTQVAPLAVTHQYLPAAQIIGTRNHVDWVFGRPDAFDFIEFQFTANIDEFVRFSIQWTEVEI